jgi:glycosyltransferase involved in cell wall biosynthesis
VASLESRKNVFFYRDFRRFTGGHLKVWHYYRHSEHSVHYAPRIHFTQESDLGNQNPWRGISPPPLEQWLPAEAAVLFLAGLDWRAVPDPAPVPVVNLIQGVRHADPDDPRRPFLSRPAVRICVSSEVADAIKATGEVNGPIHVIENALDPPTVLLDLPREIPVLIAGHKNPPFARAIHERLRVAGFPAECLVEQLPRDEFLDRIARAVVVVTIPYEREGFFLPALEAMAVGAVVVCPDCVGNRSFCRDRDTAFRPAYTLDDIVAAAVMAITQPEAAAGAMRPPPAVEVRRHGLDAERAAFLDILDSL